MKTFAKIIFVSILIMIISLLSLPSLISTQWGQEAALKLVNSSISGEVAISQMHVSWLGPQIIEELSIKDDEGIIIFSIEKFMTRTPLLGFFSKSTHIDNSQLKGLNLQLVRYANGRTNLEYALSGETPSTQEKAGATHIEIQETNGSYVAGKPGEPVTLILHGITKEENKKGTFDVQIHLAKGAQQLTQGDPIKISASLVNFPVALLEEWGGQNRNELTRVIGEAINLDLVDTAGSGEHRFSLTANSSLVSASFEGVATPEILQLTRPGELSMTLQPEVLAQLGVAAIGQGKTAQLAITIDEFTVPLQNTGEFSLKISLNERKSDPLFQGRAKEQLALTVKAKSKEEIQLTIDGAGADLQASLYLAEARAKGLLSLTPEARIAFTISNIGTSDLRFDIDGTGVGGSIAMNGLDQVDAKLAFNQFPLHTFCTAACPYPEVNRKLEVALGDTLSGEVEAHLYRQEGPVRLHLTGEHGRLQFDGNINKQYLTLTAPLIAQVKVTPALSDDILDEFFPLLSGMVSSDNPITLTIIPDEFSLPLSPIDFTKANIKHAQLNMGKVTFKDSKQFGLLLSLLNIKSKDELRAWFTPLYFSQSHQVFTLQRVDMLLMETYPFAAWGKVDFQKDKVNMEVAIGAKALKNAFELSGISDGYMMTLNFKGNRSNVSINQAKAAAKISALIAKSQGKTGQLIGTVIDIATKGRKSDKVPPPTTHPLPWN